MTTFAYQFPEDLTGTNIRNKVVNEVHTFTTNADRIFIPTGGPFFTTSLNITDNTTGVTLEPITQYKCLHLHTPGTLDSGQQVCTIILVNDTTIRDVNITYQVIGGKYGEVSTTIKDIVTGIDWDKVTRISWGSEIYGKPEVFPAAAHRHPGGEFGDWKRFHLALNNIYQAIINKDHGAWKAVYDYINRKVENSIDVIRVEVANFYTKSEVDVKINGITFDTSNLYTKQQVYNKEEVQALLSAGYTKADINAMFIARYTNAQIDALVDRGYTKAEVDAITGAGYSKKEINDSLTDINNTINNMYSKNDVNNIIASRYTKAEVDALIRDVLATVSTIKLSQLPNNELVIKPDGWFYSSLMKVKTVSDDYELTREDILTNTLIRVHHFNIFASFKDITIPAFGTSIPIGSVVHVRRIVDPVRIKGADGVSIIPVMPVELNYKGVTATLVYIGRDKWDVITEVG